MGRDFLAPSPPTPEASPYGQGLDVANAMTQLAMIMSDIRREQMKNHPEVLATTVVQGINTIPASDTNSKRVRFEVGGKPVTIYSLWAYSSFTGKVSISVNSMANINDGHILVAGDQITLTLAVDSISVVSDGSHALAINGPSDPTNGGLFLYGFTIPDYDRNRDGM